jgi:methyl-accepting chemotaxis protein
MRKRIKTKIFLGILVVIAMLATAGGISIYEFVRISGLVQSLIKDNYKTIEAGKSMVDALERKDSGVLLLLLGQFNHGSEIIRSADSAFSASLLIARHNITENGEEELIASIEAHYHEYLLSIDKSIGQDTAGNLLFYQQHVHTHFQATKDAVNGLINLNQEAMYGEATLLEAQSKRALMPGIVAILASLIFLLLLNLFISKYFVAPILTLTESIRKYTHNPKGVLVADVDSEDEIKALATSVEKLVEKLKEQE